MRLKDVPVGSLIDYLHIKIKSATVISHTAYPHKTNRFFSLVGWVFHPQVSFCWNRDNTQLPSVITIMKDYPYGCWMDSDEEVELLASGNITATVSVHTSVGMRCAISFCQESNPYAQANAPGGKYICFSCRSSGRRINE